MRQFQLERFVGAFGLLWRDCITDCRFDMGGNMVELIFLLPTIICMITIGIIAWHRRKQKTKADHEWVNRILQ